MKNKIASLVLLLALLISSAGNAHAAPLVGQEPDGQTCVGLVVVINPARNEGARGLRNVRYDCAWRWVGDPEAGHWVRFNADISASGPDFPGSDNKLVVPGEMPNWTPSDLLLMTPEELEAAGVTSEVLEQAVALYGDETSSSNGNGASDFAPGQVKKDEGEQSASDFTPAALALEAGDGGIYVPPALADAADEVSNIEDGGGEEVGSSEVCHNPQGHEVPCKGNNTP